jgi:hypothetical protein
MARTRMQHILHQLRRGILYAFVDNPPLCQKRIRVFGRTRSCDQRNRSTGIGKGKRNRCPCDACADDQHIAFQIFGRTTACPLRQSTANEFSHDRHPCLG